MSDQNLNPAPGSGVLPSAILYRPCDWFDTKEWKTIYGIQARVNSKWLHCSVGGKPMFCATEEKRDEALKKLNNVKPNGSKTEGKSHE